MKTTLLFFFLFVCFGAQAEEYDFSRGIALDEFFRINAKERDGRTLTEKENEKYNSGIWYLRGYLESSLMLAPHSDAPYTLPKEMTVRQLMLILEKMIKEHPEYLNQDTTTLVFMAFVTGFPKDVKKP